MRTLVSFATKYPATYMTICVIAGLTIRWYWAGQSLTRFFNPLFPFA